MELTGHKILLTGGTSGIGLALAKKLHQLKNKIIIVGRNEQKLKKIESRFDNIETYCADLSLSQSTQELIYYIHRKHSDLNILINNAGIQNTYYNQTFGFSNQDLKKIEDEIHINLISPIQLVAGLYQIMIKNHNPTIINITSGLAYAPKKAAPVYCASKGGLSVFTHALRDHYEEFGIKVIEVLPPLTATKMTRGRKGDKLSADEVAKQCIQKIGIGDNEIGVGDNVVLLDRLRSERKEEVLNEFKNI